MYIPEFVCGFIAGAFVGVLLVVIFSLMVAAKDDRDDENKNEGV